jgi:hypothetical protein
LRDFKRKTKKIDSEEEEEDLKEKKKEKKIWRRREWVVSREENVENVVMECEDEGSREWAEWGQCSAGSSGAGDSGFGEGETKGGEEIERRVAAVASTRWISVSPIFWACISFGYVKSGLMFWFLPPSLPPQQPNNPFHEAQIWWSLGFRV